MLFLSHSIQNIALSKIGSFFFPPSESIDNMGTVLFQCLCNMMSQSSMYIYTYFLLYSKLIIHWGLNEQIKREIL